MRQVTLLILSILCTLSINCQTSGYDRIIKEVNIDYGVGLYALTHYHLAQLDSIVDIVSEESTISLNGYADNIGSEHENLKLSNKRNEAIADFFGEKGIMPNQIKVNSHGENFISDKETSEVIKQQNRRVVIKVINSIASTTFTGFITSKDSNSRIRGKITVHLNSGKQSFETDQKGNFSIELPLGEEIQVNYSSKNHFSRLDKFTLSDKSKTRNINVSLNRMELNRKENSNLEFIRGKSILIDNSEPRLESIYEMMFDNTSICIEIGGHVFVSSSTQLSPDSEKFGLSIARSIEVYNYLVSKGISEQRMYAKGYGNSQLLFPKAKTPTEASANRRVEIKIVDCKVAEETANPEFENLEFYQTLEVFPMGRKYDAKAIHKDLSEQGSKIIEQINSQAKKMLANNVDPTTYTYIQLFMLYKKDKKVESKVSR